MLLSSKALCQMHVRCVWHFTFLAQVSGLQLQMREQAVKVEDSMWGEMLSKSAFETFWPLVSGQVLTTLLQHLTSQLIPPPLWSVMKNSLKTMGKEMMWILLPVAHALMMRPEPTPTLTLAHLYLPGSSLFINNRFFSFVLLWAWVTIPEFRLVTQTHLKSKMLSVHFLPCNWQTTFNNKSYSKYVVSDNLCWVLLK